MGAPERVDGSGSESGQEMVANIRYGCAVQALKEHH